MHELMLVDTLARPLRNLRLSVTDRCNLRCEYCMPEDEYVWLPREDMLHFEEISTLADLFITLGIDKVRLTGGEPLMRRDLPSLVQMLAVKPGLSDLALTTNGVLLAEQIDALRAAGLGRVTVSLDTLRSDRFVRLTRFDRLDAVLEGMTAASRAFGSAEAESLRPRPRSSAGGGGVPRAFKIDSVIIRGVNDDELVDLIEYGKSQNAEVRFIEYMDVGGATRWSRAHVVSRQEMLDTLARRYGAVEPVIENSSAPADRFALPDGTVFGIISSTTAPFCSSCDRSRLTADGLWYLCLYAARGIDLRRPLRGGASREELTALITAGWRERTDRGAEERLALGGERRGFVPIENLRKDPHLEMHTRGG
jgi:cyclic pyranopterin phosphate synthase